VLAENAQLHELVKKLSERVHELEGRVGKDSRTSHKPPSSDGYAKKTRSLRQRSGKKPGGQEGHPGSTRELAETPDEIVVLHPKTCVNCQASLDQVSACGIERRQQVDLPPIQAHVIEYQAKTVRCPQCQYLTQASFPPQVRARIQYGPMLKALALYLLYGQLLPYARTAELLSDLCGCPLSPGTLETFVAEGADRLVESEEQIKQRLREAEVIGADETGVRVEGRLHWLHTARTETLTHYAIDRKRGKDATDAIAILPQFQGVVVHDGLTLYPQYTQCEHALCNAHILRELRFLHEQE
jgi:transposase